MSGLERLTAMTEHLRVTPPLPPGRAARPGSWPEDEEQDQRRWEALDRDQSSAWSGFIAYTDAKGQASERRITCKKITGFGGAHAVWAFCHDRQQLRMFRIDRIGELVCGVTGEVLDPTFHFEDLRMNGAMNCEDKALVELARVLTFLARCDGHYHPLEEAALEEHFGRYAVRFGGSDRMVENAIAASGRLAPDGGDLTQALTRFTKAKDAKRLCRFVLDCGAGMIDADGRHTSEEVAWALEMSSALKSVCDA